MELVEEINTLTELQRASMDVKNALNLYTAEATNWLLEIGHTVEFREGKSISFGKGDFKVMTFYAEGIKPESEQVQSLLEKCPDLVIPYYNAEMLFRHIKLLVAPVHLKARREVYVLKLSSALNLMEVK